MPWFSWSEGIKKRACRYLLHHYLGQFLQEKLRLDQLSVDLFSGKGYVENVLLDIFAINELLQTVHAPFEILKGSVGSIFVCVPWSALLNDSCTVEVKGMEIVAQPKYRADADLADMTDSFYKSLKNMTTSMQLAQECIHEEKESAGQLYEGMEIFAQAIESILSRVKFTFTNITVRLEHFDVSASAGITLELKIGLIEYFDEDSEKVKLAKDQEQTSEPVSFACKQFKITGVSLSVGEFLDISAESSLNNVETATKPVEIAKCFGEQQVKLRIKQNEHVSGPKVDAEFYLGFSCVLVTPKQVRLLLDIASAFHNPTTGADSPAADSFPSSVSPVIPNKSLTFDDYKPNKFSSAYGNGIQETIYFDAKSINPQFPLAKSSFVDQADSIKKCTLPDKCPTSPQTFISLNDQANDRNEALNYKQPQYVANNLGDAEELFRFQIKIIAFSATILHVDPLDIHEAKHKQKTGSNFNKSGNVNTSEENQVSSYTDLVNNYFQKIKKLVNKYSLPDLFQKRNSFSNITYNHDHLRVLAGPLHIECQQQSEIQASVSSTTMIDISVGNLELLECLYENKNKSANLCHCVELLVFPTFSENKTQSMYMSTFKEQSIKLKVKFANHSESLHTSSFHIHLASCKSEVDISIIDRITAFVNALELHSQNMSSSSTFHEYSSSKARFANDQTLYEHILAEETSNEKCRKIDFNITSSNMQVEFRFPIPDLRPEIQRRPWFKRSLRDEVLYLTAIDLDCNSAVLLSHEHDLSSNDQIEITVRFRDLMASFNDETNQPPTMFLRACQYDSEELDSKNDLDMPFVQIKLHENKHPNVLLNKATINATAYHIDETHDHFSSNAYDSYQNGDIPMFASHYQNSAPKVPSPFSQRKIIYNGQEMKLPGEENEIQEFIDHASSTSSIDISMNFPVVQVNIPSKEFVASFYNRINNDLLLWEPAAPHVSGPPNDDATSTFIPSRLDLASQFFSAHDWGSKSVTKSGMHVSFATLDGDTSYTSRIEPTLTSQTETASNPSLFSISLTISKGSLSLCSAVKSELGEEKMAQLVLEIEDGNVFTVSKYHGDANLDYACFQISSCRIYHKVGLVSIPILDGSSCVTSAPSYLNPIIYPNDDVVSSVLSNQPNSGMEFDSRRKLTVVIKVEQEESRSLKKCSIAAVLQGLTMRHHFLPSGHNWLEQLLDVFDIEDTPVLGYEPPSFVTEMHLHLDNCAIDYKPLYLNPAVHVLATLNSVSLSSNLVANAPLSVFQIIMDTVSLYITDKDYHKGSTASISQSLVNVLDISLLEICMKLRNYTSSGDSVSMKQNCPILDLAVSNNHVILKTCVDSCAAMAALIRYIAEDGDIVLSDDYADSSTMENSVIKPQSDGSEYQIQEDSLTAAENISSHHSSISTLAPNCEEKLSCLIADAMQDVDLSCIETNDSSNSLSAHDESCFSNAPNLNASLNHTAQRNDAVDISFDDDDDDDDDEFFIITDPIVESFHDNTPKVEYLMENSPNIVITDNYFSPVIGKTDQLHAPSHFPTPVIRYVVNELSLSWFMYGGSDFASTTSTKKCATGRNTKNVSLQDSQVRYFTSASKQSPRFSDKKLGGINRDYSVLMEFHLTKVRFHHEAYAPEEEYTSRTVFCVTDFVIRDRLQSSQINKFLYHFHNESSPKQSHANMLQIKALLVKPAPSKPPECRLKVSLQPLRLNIDQDSLTFLTEFFTTLAATIADDIKLMNDTRSTAYGTTLSTSPDPQLEFDSTTETPLLETSTSTNTEQQPSLLQPLFFREFIFSPDVPIRLDYQGKHIDMEQGKIAGLLMGLGQLNCSQLKLKKIVHRRGLLGLDRVVNFALNVWAADIRTNQFPSILGGVGPLHSVVQFFQGFKDLVFLPVEQYRRDGRIIRGLQRGTSSFGTSTTMAMLELTNRFVSLVQTAAETACDVVSPIEYQRSQQQQLNSWRGLEKHALKKRQPADMMEGLSNAVMLVRDGVSDTASSIARVAQKEHDRKGLTGAVGGVLRHIPLTLVKPVVFASEATSNMLSGMRNQLLPDAKREEENKWRASTNTA